MRRREFITLLGGAVAAWPLMAGAQQPDRVRRVAFLHGLAESDQRCRPVWLPFEKGLRPSDGWKTATFRSSIGLPVAILLASSNTSRN